MEMRHERSRATANAGGLGRDIRRPPPPSPHCRPARPQPATNHHITHAAHGRHDPCIPEPRPMSQLITLTSAQCDGLLFTSMATDEQLGRMFSYHVEFASRDEKIDLG